MSKIAPGRFIAFIVLFAAGSGVALLRTTALQAVMLGFDVASLVFLGSCLPLLNDTADQMRKHSHDNDANRGILLGITVAVTTVILVAVGAVIADANELHLTEVAMVVGTLVLAWIFGNSIYALHYAHMYYVRSKTSDGDTRGIDFPSTEEPDYWDFLYFAFTLGMTFQTSDCDVASRSIRRVMLGHCMAAFIFNLGVLAFTINALGSGS